MRSYAPGDIVDFKWCEDYGLIEVSIGEDGRLAAPIRCPHTLDLFGRQPDPTVVAPGITADMNSFWDDDAEVYGETLEQFISAYVASFADDLPCSVDVQCAGLERQGQISCWAGRPDADGNPQIRRTPSC